jgi:hypothetical protein
MIASDAPSTSTRADPSPFWQFGFVVAVFAASLASIAWGLAKTALVTELPWPTESIRQVALVALLVICCAGLAFLIDRKLRIRWPASLLLATVFGSLCIFGFVPTAQLSVFVLSSTAIGIFLSNMLGSAQLKLPPLSLSVTGGAAIYALVLTLISPIPINTPLLHAGLACGPLLLLLHPNTRRALIVATRASYQTGDGKVWPHLLTGVGLTTLCFLLLLHALFAGMPERYWDAMVMHLYIPSYVSGHRAWEYDASSYLWAFFPAGVDWLYTSFYLVSGELGARLYNVTAFALLCAVLYETLRRFAAAHIAIWIVVLFASMPVAFLESATLFVEHTLALWITAAVAIILASDLKIDIGSFILSLVLLGAACVSKLHGALATVVIGPVLLILFLKGRPPAGQIAKAAIATCLVGVSAVFPYALSSLHTGNPVFPLYNDIFRSPYYPPVAFYDSRWIGHLDWQILYNATFFSGRFLEAESGALGLSAILLVPIAFTSAIVQPKPRTIMVLAIALAIAAPILASIQYLRYIYPLFPLLFVASAPALTVLEQNRLARPIVIALLMGVTIFNVYKSPSAGWLLQGPDFRVVFDARLRRALTEALVPERLANELINMTAGSTARVLYTGSPYGALLQGKALYTDWYNPQLNDAFTHLTDPEQVRALLSRWQVSHVVQNDAAPKPGQAILSEYLNRNYRPIATFGRAVVYSLQAGTADNHSGSRAAPK